MTPCYTDACALRDEVSGEWSGAAAECTAGAPFCEECFTDSPCYGFGISVEEEVETVPDSENEEGIDEDNTAVVKEEASDADSDESTNEEDAPAVADPATGQDINDTTSFHLHSIGCLVVFWNVSLLFL